MKVKVITPEQCIRRVFQLSKEEVISAVKAYAKAQNEEIPEGDIFIWGLEHRSSFDEEETLSLVVDTPIS